MRGIRGEAAFVTGAAGGIGASVARGLARCGASVLVTDVRLADASGVAAQIRQEGGTAEALALDVSRRCSANRNREVWPGASGRRVRRRHRHRRAAGRC